MGYYLIKKILEYITYDLVKDFFKNIICPSFMEISLSSHGSRVIQKILTLFDKTPNLMQIFNENLKDFFVENFFKSKFNSYNN